MKCLPERYRPFILLSLLSVGCFLMAAGAEARNSVKDIDAPTAPPALEELETVPKLDQTLIDEETGMPFDIRAEAIREAALSYGARGGLAHRTFEIRQELDTRSSYLDRVFDFRTLLIAAPSGLLIEPPVVSESINAMLIDSSGTEAAVSDRIYDIITNARIVSAPRTWRNYLEREWGEVTPPPDILRPETPEEREKWIELVNEGWQQGIRQANEIFQDDLNELTADYQGMVRYRLLLSQGIISPPYAVQLDRGVTGGGNSLRVGDRAVQITGMPQLLPGSETWKPANR